MEQLTYFDVKLSDKIHGYDFNDKEQELKRLVTSVLSHPTTDDWTKAV